MSQNKIWKVAIFGMGRMGTQHFQNIAANENFEIVWIVDNNGEQVHTLLKSHVRIKDGVNVVLPKEDGKVFKDKSVDAIFIFTPPKFHPSIAIRALKSGKAVFCEKPMAYTLDDVKDMYKAAAKYNKPLYAAFMRRFDPSIRKCYKRIQSGEVGKVRVVTSLSRDPKAVTGDIKKHAMKGGDLFLNSAVHDIDVVCWMVGERPTTVFATGSVMDPEYKEAGELDTAHIILTFPRGVIGVINMDRGVNSGYDQRLEVLTSDALLASAILHPTSFVEIQGDSVCTDMFQEYLSRYRESYLAELDHFMDVLNGNSSLETTAESTITVHEIIKACQKSVRSGKIVNV